MKTTDSFPSEAQKNFLVKYRQHKQMVSISRIMLFLSFLLLWEVSAANQWIDSFFFSSPSGVIACFLEMSADGSLLTHTGITILETLLSFLLVTVISILISSLLWYYRFLSEVTEPYLVILNSLPKSALAPLFIVWLGTGINTIIVAGISVALFGSCISIYSGFKEVDPEKVTLIYTLGGSRRTAFFKVILPGSLPVIVSTTKSNIGLALVGVIIGEFLAARRGLGYLIIYGSQVFQLDLLITSIIILCIIAFLLYKLIQYLEYRVRKSHHV